jgi:hypothetical protein
VGSEVAGSEYRESRSESEEPATRYPLPATRSSVIHLAERSMRAGRLLEHLRWHIEGLRLERGVCGIAVEAEELAPLDGQQLKLLPGEDGRIPRPERLLRARDVLARLRARWGDETVRQAELVDSRRPEEAFKWKEPGAGSREPGEPGTPRSSPGSRLPHYGGTPDPHAAPGSPLWLPEPEEVEVRRGGPGPDGRHQTPLLKRGGRRRRIVHAEGPWRLVEPWAADPLARDTYHVETADGAAHRLLYDHLAEQWRLHGMFD